MALETSQPIRFIAPGEKILHHPDLISDVTSRTSRVPRHFELDPTNRCNLACEGCHFAYIHQSPGDSNLDMPVPLFKKIAEDMAQNDVRAITFTGGGEPLFHPKHLEMFRIAKETGLQMGMYTNGVLLSGETAEFVAENFEWCYVSLDAVTPEEFQRYKRRGPTTFRTNVENIRNISSQKDRKAVIDVGYLVGRHNLDNIGEAIPYLLDLGTDLVQVRPLIDVGSYQEQRQQRHMSGLAFESPDQAAWQEHYSWIPQTRAILGEYEGTPRLDTSSKKFADLYLGKRTYDTCLSTSLAGCIGAQGEAWLCVNTRGINQLGDLNHQTLAEIYGEKPIAVEDVTKCRIMCRLDQLNQTLAVIDSQQNPLPIPNPSIKHINFV